MTPRWRVGRPVQRPEPQYWEDDFTVYEGDRPICRCSTPEDAARIVAAMNANVEAASTRRCVVPCCDQAPLESSFVCGHHWRELMPK